MHETIDNKVCLLSPCYPLDVYAILVLCFCSRFASQSVRDWFVSLVFFYSASSKQSHYTFLSIPATASHFLHSPSWTDTTWFTVYIKSMSFHIMLYTIRLFKYYAAAYRAPCCCIRSPWLLFSEKRIQNATFSYHCNPPTLLPSGKLLLMTFLVSFSAAANVRTHTHPHFIYSHKLIGRHNE